MVIITPLWPLCHGEIGIAVQSDLEIPDSLWEENPDEGNAEDGFPGSGIVACCCENGWRCSLLAKPSDFCRDFMAVCLSVADYGHKRHYCGNFELLLSKLSVQISWGCSKLVEAPSPALCAACSSMGIAWVLFAGTVEECPLWGWDLSSDPLSTRHHSRRRTWAELLLEGELYHPEALTQSFGNHRVELSSSWCRN